MCAKKEEPITYGTLDPEVNDVEGRSGYTDATERSDFFRHFAGEEGRARMWKLIGLMFAFFMAYVNVSCPLTFLSDALKKNIDASDLAVGAAYASHPMGIAVSQFFTGAIERRIGNKEMMRIGFIVAGLATVAGAFAFKLFSGTVPVLSYIVGMRFVAGLGEGLSDCAIINMYQMIFSDILGQVMGMSEGIIGIGYAVGPLLGGGLYGVWGFEVPLLAVAAPFFVIAVVLPPFLPQEKMADLVEQPQHNARDSASLHSRAPESLQSYVKSFILTAGIFVGCLGYGALAPLISEFLDDKLGYSDVLVGGIFAVGGFLYLLAGIVVGRICDRRIARENYTMTVFWVGTILEALSFLAGGPVPIVRLSPAHAVPFIIASMAMVTMSLSGQIIGGMSLLSLHAPSHAVASALFNFALNLGLALGPLSATLFKTLTDFEWAMTSNFFILTAFLIIAYPALVCGLRREDRLKEEARANGAV